MSTETVKICDIQNCGKVAHHTLDYFTIAVRDINQERQRAEDGLHLWTSIGVDLCGGHEHEYRTSLPELKLNQMREVA